MNDGSHPDSRKDFGHPALARIASLCHGAGFDLAAAFRVQSYNKPMEEAHRLPDFGRSSTPGLLVGNSRALWSPFIRWLAADPKRLGLSDPLDTYTESVITSAADRVLPAYGVACRIRWAHRPEKGHIAFQQLAEISGLAWRSPAYFSVHETFGPWIAMRAALVLDLRRTNEQTNDKPDGERGGAALRPCHLCKERCAPALALALEQHPDALPDHAAVRARWRPWLAVRSACPLGAEHRYTDGQIRYHYLKDRTVLEAAVRLALQPGSREQVPGDC